MEQIGTVADTDIVEDDVDGQMTVDPPISVTGIVVVEDANSVDDIVVVEDGFEVEIMVDHPNSVAGTVAVEDVVGGEGRRPKLKIDGGFSSLTFQRHTHIFA